MAIIPRSKNLEGVAAHSWHKLFEKVCQSYIIKEYEKGNDIAVVVSAQSGKPQDKFN